MQAAKRERLKQNAEPKEKEKAYAKAARKAELRAKEGIDAKVKPEIKSEEVCKDGSTPAHGGAEEAKLKIEKLQRQLAKVEKRAARAAAKVSKLKAEASRYEEVNQMTLQAPKSTKLARDGGVGAVIVSSHSQGSEVVSGTVPLKEENLERLIHTNGEVTLSGIEPKEAGDGGFEASGKLSDPLTPTSQPCVQQLELKQEHEAVAIALSPADEASDVARPSKDEHGDLAHPASSPKPDGVAIRSGVSLSTSLSSSTLSLSDSEDMSTSDGSTSSSTSSSAPDSRPSKRVQPDRVAPPKRAKNKAICRNFLHHGRCKKGDACVFRHELPNRANQGERHHRRASKAFPGEDRRRRIGLYQRVTI